MFSPNLAAGRRKGSLLMTDDIKVRHEPTIRTGYNLGFNKATFATTFDKREYFEKNIRQQNK